MEIGSFAAFFAAAVSLVVSIFSIRQSRLAQRDTRSYKDAVFVLEPLPFELRPNLPHDQLQAQVAFRLVNKGESFATDVRAKGDFDPFGLHLPIMKWHHIAGGGGAVEWQTGEPITSMSSGVFDRLQSGSDAALCTVEFISQAGQARVQQIPIPRVYDAATFVFDDVDPSANHA